MNVNSRTREYKEGWTGRRRTYVCRKCGEKFQVDTAGSLPEDMRVCEGCKVQNKDSEYLILTIDKLQPFLMRSLRPNVLEKLKERIAKGYNPARPLSVIPRDGFYIVADGNHRLKVLADLGIKEVPVLVQDGDPYMIGLSSNQDEDTYAPMDLFDWLDIIRKLRDEGLTQEKIGERIGWSRESISKYTKLTDRVGTDIIEAAMNNQIGRVPEDGTGVPYHFTEGWFRDSGLYDLNPEYQLKLMHDFINDKCNWRKEKVQHESAKYKRWQDYLKIAQDELVNQDDLPELKKIIENNTFRDENQLRRKITDLNKDAQNKLICGDATIELLKLDDASIDIVVTDPPYGIEYTSNYSKYAGYVSKSPIDNDELEVALGLLDKTLEILNLKTKPDSHFYIFTSWKVYPLTKSIIDKYFTVKNAIIWDKGNWSAGDLEGAWGNQYEIIIFATKGNRPLKRRGDILSIPRINTINSITSTQKPVDLIKEILKVSAMKADLICDPFMGSGAIIKATKDFGALNYIGIEIDRTIFNRACAFIND